LTRSEQPKNMKTSKYSSARPRAFARFAQWLISPCSHGSQGWRRHWHYSVNSLPLKTKTCQSNIQDALANHLNRSLETDVGQSMVT